MEKRVEVPYGAQTLVIETGKLAKQANAAVKVSCGETTVLVTVCMAKEARTGIDFFPLMVEYQEKTYAAGKIPGGFFKREARPTEKEILTSRLIDRPIRPLFPEGFFNDVQVVATTISHDGENDADILAIVGASACLMVSDIPFDGPIGAVRIGMIDGEFVANPTYAQREQSVMDFIIVGREEGIVMIEGDANQIPDDKIKEMLAFAMDALQPSRTVQFELQEKAGKAKVEVPVKKYDQEFIDLVHSKAKQRVIDAYTIADKLEREAAVNAVYADLTSDMSVYAEFKNGDEEIKEGDLYHLFEELQYDEIRKAVFEQDQRADGRGAQDIREISTEVGILARAHGSALFTRGQTQSLSVATLGTKIDEQLIEGLTDKEYRRFILHYNFPSFSVGEARPMRGPGRREIGHGALAHRALKNVLPSKEDFPYTIRLVSEILESNGSSSMASVCGGSLAMHHAGVPLLAPVAGISIGLMTEGDKAVLLSDIMGMEDHFGDMDFKVAGSATGITAIQLDLKLKSVSLELLGKALDQAKSAREFILGKMAETIREAAPMSPHAPRIHQLTVPQDKIGEVIGPGGKTIRKIIEETGATAIDINDEGVVLVSAPNGESLDKAVTFIAQMMEVPEVGKIYDAVVKKVMDFGAFVEFLPGKEGLVHVSQLSTEYVKDPHSICKEGDEFKVKLVEIDRQKRLNLSRKAAEEELSGKTEKTEAAE